MFIQSAWCHPLTGTSVMLSHCAVKGVRFLSFFCLTASFDREFLSPKVQQKKQRLWRLLFMTVFFSPELSFTSGRIDGEGGDLTTHSSADGQSGWMLRTRINHSSWWWTGGSCCHSLSRDGLVREKHWPRVSFSEYNTAFLYVAKPRTDLKGRCAGVTHRGQLTCGEVHQCPWKLLCNVFCGSDESFGWMSSGLFIYLRTSVFSRQGGSDNDVSDWVTLESNVFKLYRPWGIQVGVIQVHGILI